MKEILNTYDGFSNFPYSCYLEYCEDMNIEAGKENSKEYFDFVYDSIDQERDDFFTNLKYSKINNMSCVTTGILGRWDGKHNIYPDFSDNLTDAILKATSGYDDCIISYDSDCIQVQGLHHDGRDIFEIRLLSDKGDGQRYEYENEDKDFDFEDKDNFVAIPEYLF